MAHPSAVITPAPLRRAIAAILRGGLLLDRDRIVVQRLALDGRSSLRLAVGLRESALTTEVLDAIHAHLRDLGAEIAWESLRWSLDYALSTADRKSHAADRLTISERAKRLHGDADAAELVGAGLSAALRLGLNEAQTACVRGRLAVLHLLGATVEQVPDFVTVVRAWALAPA